MNIKVRFPPSPTGPMHIGTARALLFNFLFAKRHNGTVIYRSEDTDRERSTPAYEQELIDGMAWLGLTYNEGPIRQSERYDIYETYFQKLKNVSAVYPSYETAEELEEINRQRREQKLPPGYNGNHRDLTPEQIAAFEAEGRKPVWRVRVPDEEISFTDTVRGEIREHGNNVSDFVIRKSNGQFLYHFVVVVDDIDMGITHVIRGEDHISNTTKHLILFQAFGAEIPQFAHLPLLLNADRSKMSKRDDSGRPMTIARLADDGYLPEAVMNYLAMLGWNPGDGDTREFFTPNELMQEFSLERVGKAGAVFDLDRLGYVNAHYLQQLPAAERAALIRPHCNFEIADDDYFERCIELVGDRIRLPSDAPMALRFLFVEPEVEPDLYPHKKMKVELPDALMALKFSLPIMQEIAESSWNEEKIQEIFLQKIAKKELKNGQILWPLRVALTGEKFSPGTFEVAAILGKERSIARTMKEIDKLKIIV